MQPPSFCESAELEFGTATTTNPDQEAEAEVTANLYLIQKRIPQLSIQSSLTDQLGSQGNVFTSFNSIPY